MTQAQANGGASQAAAGACCGRQGRVFMHGAEVNAFQAMRHCATHRTRFMGACVAKGLLLGAIGAGIWLSYSRSKKRSEEHRLDLEARLDKLTALQLENAAVLQSLKGSSTAPTAK
eukprot:CAMPEP_0113678314 /NCGR_PEP_ID=MMETSP0038_2-20120614/9862_1 /TAXON_ID=2898 /ORGANISM="Cryptomonas paramecium" /LENGTH=115 /DNA_ID=CAMNT_0000595905 /DNA_START=58 /DNA_END=405 /DNA_ORIENTATION=+ /assembly_acc=CAM_ASM_000170